eukprot:279247_1
MGNKNVKQTKTKNETNTITTHIPIEYFEGKYEIMPKNAKFKKIDLVKYGKIFDNFDQLSIDNIHVTTQIDSLKSSMTRKEEIKVAKYTRMKKMGFPLKSIRNKMQQDGTGSALIDKFLAPDIDSKENGGSINKWYLRDGIRLEIWRKCKTYQFPLYELLEFCVMYSQNELIEFILTQELIETDYWTRDFFKCVLFTIIGYCSKTIKLSSLKVFSSYMIPEYITKDELYERIQETHKEYRTNNNGKFINWSNEMVEKGMNGRVQRIIQTKIALTDNLNHEFPKELIGIIITLAYGMFHQKRNQETENSD